MDAQVMASDATPPSETHGSKAEPKQKKSPRKMIPLVIGGALLCLLLLAGGYWFAVGRFIEATDDAYVKADIVFLAPQVSGTVTEIHVRDNQHVEAGDTLFVIDPADYEIAVASAKAAVATAEADVAENQSQIELQKTTLEVDQADITAAEADLTFAQDDYKRIAALRKTDTSTERSFQSAQAALANAEATLRKNQAVLTRDQQQLSVLAARQDSLRAVLGQAEATLRARELDQQRTVIRAPVAGQIGNRQIEVGAYLEPGVQAISLVPDDIYVEANFKETQVEHFRIGMPVQVSADMLGGMKLQGEIDSLSPATGAEFAVLPPQNATGNFTKIVQRIPVKIHFKPGQADVQRLHAGTSVVAEIDTREHK